MPKPLSIVCACDEHATDVARAAAMIGAVVETETTDAPLEAASARVADAPVLAVVTDEPPSPEALVALSDAASAAHTRVALAFVRAAADPLWRHLAHDLGMPAVTDVEALLSTAAWLRLGVRGSVDASPSGLTPHDRARFGEAPARRERRPRRVVRGSLERSGGGLFAWRPDDGGAPVVLGTARAVRAALAALDDLSTGRRPPAASVEGVNTDAVRESLFGPPRALSDPTSKSVLAAYDVPLPLEELCASATRAAAEATQIGFPVRLAIASPDLRIWDHPDLVTDGVDNAARVRDVYRQTLAFARARQPDARLLGVTVSATTTAIAELRAHLSCLDGDRVLARIGFADPHGLASADETLAVLPWDARGVAQVLGRLEGASLLFGAAEADAEASVRSVGEILLRTAALVRDHRDFIDAVELDPIALLPNAAAEVREACVHVSDGFERLLASPRAAAR
ncbi:MAG: acetate--CoA ligase family protein [Myxococcales bacterium]|nr:acetate--CoA ligase family protein [Myxococcales bacterium]